MGGVPPHLERAKCLLLEAHLTAVVGRETMNTEHSPVLEFPAWHYGTKAAIRRKVGWV